MRPWTRRRTPPRTRHPTVHWQPSTRTSPRSTPPTSTRSWPTSTTRPSSPPAISWWSARARSADCSPTASPRPPRAAAGRRRRRHGRVRAARAARHRRCVAHPRGRRLLHGASRCDRARAHLPRRPRLTAARAPAGAACQRPAPGFAEHACRSLPTPPLRGRPRQRGWRRVARDAAARSPGEACAGRACGGFGDPQEMQCRCNANDDIPPAIRRVVKRGATTPADGDHGWHNHDAQRHPPGG